MRGPASSQRRVVGRASKRREISPTGGGQSHAAQGIPNIPTMKEIGFADVGTVAWNGLFAPAATPKPVLEALFTAVTEAVNSPEVVEKLNKQNFNVVPNKSLADANFLGEIEALAEHRQHGENRGGAVEVTLRS